MSRHCHSRRTASMRLHRSIRFTKFRVCNRGAESQQLASQLKTYARVLRPGGSLILFDGFMDASSMQESYIRPRTGDAAENLAKFWQEYEGSPVSFSPMESGFRTTL